MTPAPDTPAFREYAQKLLVNTMHEAGVGEYVDGASMKEMIDILGEDWMMWIREQHGLRPVGYAWYYFEPEEPNLPILPIF
ncbi:MAG: hypothetical protein OXI83_16490 [Gemmatimonadota bacterium]|nr:hypothetical protein [Gemmatimonadota bacterium]